MPVYFVTGKLGGGKSLVAVSKIREYLNKGLKVATNLDIRLKPMIGSGKKKTELYRIPDKPILSDMLLLGYGNRSYDEDKNGLIVLDECATWFNSRSWADKERQGLINWFLHARKLGWDIIFIIQDVKVVDKQARLSLAEHVVYSRRTDRMNVPLVGGLFKMFTGERLPLPKMFMASVRYGDQPTSLKVDTWTTFGSPSLYASYDTKQMFSDSYSDGVYRVLPPYYTHGRYGIKYNLVNIMRLTRIYFRKYNRITAMAAGLAISFFIFNEPDPLFDNHVQITEPPDHEVISALYISSSVLFPDSAPRFTFTSRESGDTFTINQLRDKGYDVKTINKCGVFVNYRDEFSKRLSCG